MVTSMRQAARSSTPHRDLEREPVGDDLRTGVALERRDRPIDRRKRPDRAVAVERPHAGRRAAASGRRWRGTARPRGKARRQGHAAATPAPAGGAPARRDRCAAPTPVSAFALFEPPRGSVESATPASSPAAASRAADEILRLRRRAPRPTLPSAAAAAACASASARTRGSRISTAAMSAARAGRTAAADSASARSAAARPGATSPARTWTPTAAPRAS